VGELTAGNFASSILLEIPHKKYFVFGDSGAWGKYAANDYTTPIDILGFKPEGARIFGDKFKVSESEEIELAQVLPQAYKTAVRGTSTRLN
jgi:hypothetical protein